MDQDSQEESTSKLKGLVLEEPCTFCGRIARDNSWCDLNSCNKCFGTGMQPTSEGEKILSLISHHLADMLVYDGTVQELIERHCATE